MGNSITNPNTGYIDTNTNTSRGILGEHITDWAKEEYSMDPTDPDFNGTLLKRACCTGQKKIPIALPGFDRQKIGFSTFASYVDFTNKTCTFGQDDYKKPDGKNSAASCKPFYKKMCEKVYDSRKNHFSSYNKAYGKFPDSDIKYIKNNENAFVDCNCENSLYVKEFNNLKDKIKKGTKSDLSSDADLTGIGENPAYLAQNADSRCKSNVTKDNETKSWYEQYLKEDGFCLNIIAADEVKASDGGKINLEQSCNLKSGVGTKVKSEAQIAFEEAETARKIKLAKLEQDKIDQLEKEALSKQEGILNASKKETQETLKKSILNDSLKQLNKYCNSNTWDVNIVSNSFDECLNNIVSNDKLKLGVTNKVINYNQTDKKCNVGRDVGTVENKTNSTCYVLGDNIDKVKKEQEAIEKKIKEDAVKEAKETAKKEAEKKVQIQKIQEEQKSSTYTTIIIAVCAILIICGSIYYFMFYKSDSVVSDTSSEISGDTATSDTGSSDTGSSDTATSDTATGNTATSD